MAYTFETALIVLEGLLQYRNRYSVEDRRLSEAEENGQEYLLKHELYLAGGKAIKKQWTSFSFPPYWFYDVLTVLEYFRCSGRIEINVCKQEWIRSMQSRTDTARGISGVNTLEEHISRWKDQESQADGTR